MRSLYLSAVKNFFLRETTSQPDQIRETRTPELIELHRKQALAYIRHNPHPALSHLKITIPIEEYKQIIESVTDERGIVWYEEIRKKPEFWDRIPTYTIARCPFCGSIGTFKLDTHSIHGWNTDHYGYVKLGQPVFHENCFHYTASHVMIQLNGLTPSESINYHLHKYSIKQPYIVIPFLPDDVEGAAVMHSLPICRPAGGYLPCYTLFLITYFSTDPNMVLARARLEERQKNPDSWPSWPPLFRHRREMYDFQSWIDQGKLYWLDLNQPDLPLKSEPLEAFPYLPKENSEQT